MEPDQNRCHFTDEYINSKEKLPIFFQMSLKFVSKDPVDNDLVLLQVIKSRCRNDLMQCFYGGLARLPPKVWHGWEITPIILCTYDYVSIPLSQSRLIYSAFRIDHSYTKTSKCHISNAPIYAHFVLIESDCKKFENCCTHNLSIYGKFHLQLTIY